MALLYRQQLLNVRKWHAHSPLIDRNIGPASEERQRFVLRLRASSTTKHITHQIQPAIERAHPVPAARQERGQEEFTSYHPTSRLPTQELLRRKTRLKNSRTSNKANGLVPSLRRTRPSLQAVRLLQRHGSHKRAHTMLSMQEQRCSDCCGMYTMSRTWSIDDPCELHELLWERERVKAILWGLWWERQGGGLGLGRRSGTWQPAYICC